MLSVMEWELAAWEEGMDPAVGAIGRPQRVPPGADSARHVQSTCGRSDSACHACPVRFLCQAQDSPKGGSGTRQPDPEWR